MLCLLVCIPPCQHRICLGTRHRHSGSRKPCTWIAKLRERICLTTECTPHSKWDIVHRRGWRSCTRCLQDNRIQFLWNNWTCILCRTFKCSWWGSCCQGLWFSYRNSGTCSTLNRVRTHSRRSYSSLSSCYISCRPMKRTSTCQTEWSTSLNISGSCSFSRRICSSGLV